MCGLVEVWASKDGRGWKLLSEGCGSFLICSLFGLERDLSDKLKGDDVVGFYWLA